MVERPPRTALAGASAFLLSLAYFALLLRYGINLDDEGTLLFQFARMAEGQTPYLDFHAGYTPGVYYLHSFLHGMFDGSVLAGRVVLAFVNAASAAMLAMLVTPLAGAWAGGAAAALFVSLLPLHPAHFAVFNIPYPSWYSVAVFLAGLFPVRAFLRGRSVAAAAAAGAAAGVGFLFKPNVGAFQLACTMLLVLSVLPRSALPSRPHLRTWWWLVWASVLAGMLAVFGGVPGLRELTHLLVPAIACAMLTVLLAGSVPHARDRHLIASTMAVGGGFVGVTLVWLLPLMLRLPLGDVLEKVLFIGSDFAPFFYVAHPQALLGAGVVIAAYVGLTEGSARASQLTSARAIAVGLVVAILAAAAVLVTRPMVHGFGASVMSALEAAWCYRVAIAVHWLLLAMIWTNIASPAARTSPGADARAATLTVLGYGAPFLYMQIYPRTDFTHWVWAAPLSVAGAVVLLSRLSQACGAVLQPPARAPALLVVWLPVAVVVLVRGAGALAVIADDRGLGGAQSVELTAPRAPVRTGIGRAEQYRDLDAATSVLRDASSAGEAAFAFPVLDALLFLAERGTPVADSYFFPGWLGRDDEAAVVEALERERPRLAVVLREHRPFFDDAPAYYQLLGRMLERDYRLYASAGRYAILVRRDADAPAPSQPPIPPHTPDVRLAAYLHERLGVVDEADLAEALHAIAGDRIEGHYEEVTALLQHRSEHVRAAAVHALRAAGDDRSAAALARAAVEGRLPAREQTLALRLAGAWAGARTADVLAPHAAEGDAEVREAAANALAHSAERRLQETFWVPRPEPDDIAMDDAARARIVAWLIDAAADPRLKLFAAMHAAQAGATSQVFAELGRRCPQVSGGSEAGRSPIAASDPCLLPAHAALSGMAPTPMARAALLVSLASAAADRSTRSGRSVAYALALRVIAEEPAYGPAAARLFVQDDPAAEATLAAAIAGAASQAQRSELEYLARVVAMGRAPAPQASAGLTAIAASETPNGRPTVAASSASTR